MKIIISQNAYFLMCKLCTTPMMLYI